MGCYSGLIFFFINLAGEFEKFFSNFIHRLQSNVWMFFVGSFAKPYEYSVVNTVMNIIFRVEEVGLYGLPIVMVGIVYFFTNF